MVEGIQEKGISNNAPLNYGHVNYSRLSRAHNKSSNNEFESAQCAVLYRNNKNDDGINRNLRYIKEE